MTYLRFQCIIMIITIRKITSKKLKIKVYSLQNKQEQLFVMTTLATIQNHAGPKMPQHTAHAWQSDCSIVKKFLNVEWATTRSREYRMETAQGFKWQAGSGEGLPEHAYYTLYRVDSRLTKIFCISYPNLHKKVIYKNNNKGFRELVWRI